MVFVFSLSRFGNALNDTNRFLLGVFSLISFYVSLALSKSSVEVAGLAPSVPLAGALSFKVDSKPKFYSSFALAAKCSYAISFYS